MNDTPLIRRFTEDDVVRWFGAHEVAKARPYVGAIQRIEIDDKCIAAAVQGTSSQPYRVLIDFADDNSRRRMPISSACSCPVGAACKHGAAVLLAAIRQRAMAADTVRPEVQQWLLQLQGLVNPRPAVPGKVKRAAPVLQFLIEPPRPGTAWQVTAWKSSATSNGDFSRSARPWSNFETALLKPPAFLDDDDLAIVRLLWAQRGRDYNRYWSAGLPLAGKHAVEALGRILATGRGWIATGKHERVRLAPGDERPATLHWAVEPTGMRAELLASPRATHTLPLAPPWYADADTGTAGPIRTDIPADVLAHLLALPVLGESEALIVAENLERLSPRVPRPTALQDIPQVDEPLRAVLRIEHTFGEAPLADEEVTVALPRFEYGHMVFAPGHAGNFARDAEGRTVRVRRDEAGERQLVATLAQAGLRAQPRQHFDVPDGYAGAEAWTFHYEDAWMAFESDVAPRLAAGGWRIELPETFFYRIHRPEAWYAEIEDTGLDYTLAMGIEVNGQRLALAPLIHMMLKNDPRWFDGHERMAIADDEPVRFFLEDGMTIEVPAGRLKPLVSTLVDLLDRPASTTVRLSVLDTARLVEATAGADWKTRGMEPAISLFERLKAAGGVTPATPPPGFGAQLRPYQLHGLAWLQYLRANRLGGILADDMGLGKTAQTLAHLLVEQQAGRLGAGPGGRPALVVLPTSLIFNWKREAATFAPQLKVLSLHGQDRKARFAAIPEHDILLTTYPLLWRDAEVLTGHHYHTLVLDEAQMVKNAASRAAETVRRIRADHRLCLTGTPLENHLGELWAQFDFLLPGFLGDARQFAREWRTPIEKRGDGLRREVLARRIRPFILRRKKEDVARELPPKSIIVRTVELAGGQRDLYETVRASMDQRVRDEIARRGFARSQIVILDALLKLRQTCCDPRLLKSDAARRVKEGAKLELLMGMLPELVDEGRRVLVFSQFAEMLDLIENELVDARLDFVRLSGRTKDRETPIRRFQAGEVPIFLISLKAGGVGLNLTAADTVIHYDPWWNPAAENQATDRAHRIGQTKQVFVYKLIVAGSIEEKILDLQDRKAALAEGILSDKADALAKFSADDIAALLAPLND